MRRFLAAIILLVGIALLAGSGFAAWREVAFRRDAVETNGLVVEMLSQSSRDSDGRTSRTYKPVFIYSLPDGTKRRAEATVWSNPPCCTVGEAIRVRYRPEAPDQAYMIGFMESWFLTTMLGGMGLVFTLVGAAVGRATPRGMAAVAPAMPGPAAFATTLAVPLVGLRRQAAGGGMAWVLQARWSDPRSGMQRLFEGPPLPFDPVPQMRTMTSVPITFNPDDPTGPYAMDLSFLVAPPPAQVGPVRRG